MFPATTSGRWLVGMSAGVIVLVAVAIVVSLATNAGGRDDLPAGSPERAVQEFLLALQDGDAPAAYELLSDELQDRCSLADFEDATRFMVRDQDGQVRLESVRELSTGTEVVINVSYVDTSFPFTTDRSTTHRYLLDEVSGAWRLTQVQWPYLGCRIPLPTPTPVPTSTPVEA